MSSAPTTFFQTDPDDIFGLDIDRFPHPFTEVGEDHYDFYGDVTDECDSARTLVELRMCALSAAIREKPEWHVKFRDEKIRSTCQAEEVRKLRCPELVALTGSQINHVMTELEAYVALRDENTGIEPGPYERTWKSDTLIPATVKCELLAAVAPLESVPDSEKDWHPNSDGKVLDLVHPSLYPVVYGRTESTSGEILEPREDGLIDPQFTSERFQWLPSDFRVAEDGSVSLASPYINNVHPKDQAELEKVIPKLLERVVPMFEWVLSDLRFKHQDKKPKTWPESKPSYDGGLDGVKKTVDFRGKTMQVIVKLSNIVLTPEKPEYGGGTWHVDAYSLYVGMNNEAIVATFIYYYDCDNITESTLSFRNAIHSLRYHRQDDKYCMYYLYGLNRGDRCVQDVGKITTKQDRCLAFPNIYQHLVSPFRLADPTRSGRRKILAFFLVDPHVRIPSASTVGPQQAAWMQRAVAGTQLWGWLPTELRDIVWAHAGRMTEEEAKEYRQELMKERTAFVKIVDGERFGTEFNMWYVLCRVLRTAFA
ncbi:hypothetical protein FOMPIDRAFT_1110227 [Fomitopsis schrenkii]|uniref:Uncharacterized protein n=1 Tax=Fomitopsis schrenkii TaxID=2126942 RepID=S8EQD2_FOMSC|nr:hypothetical protein FOMPIDRAFT_1110227 [Fomitopsis schrenkii]